MQQRGAQVRGRLLHNGRLDPTRKKTFYYGAQELFLRAEAAKERHFAKPGFDSNFPGGGAF
jgi:hypothetical protein